MFCGHGTPYFLYLGEDGYSGTKRESMVDRRCFSFEDNIYFKYFISPLVELVGKVINYFTGKHYSNCETWCKSFRSLAKDGKIILDSCSVGAGADNLAQAISSLSHRTVIAPTENIGCSVTEDSLFLDDFTTSNIRFKIGRVIKLYKYFGLSFPFFFKRDVTVIYEDGKKVSFGP